MIEIEIVNSPDREALGIRKFYFDKIFLGLSNKNNLVIHDPKLGKCHLSIEIHPNGISCRSVGENNFFIDEKKMLGEKKFLPHSAIQIGDTTFKVLTFFSTPKKEASQDFEDNYSTINESSPEIIDILDQLENEIKIIEQEKYARD